MTNKLKNKFELYASSVLKVYYSRRKRSILTLPNLHLGKDGRSETEEKSFKKEIYPNITVRENF